MSDNKAIQSMSDWEEQLAVAAKEESDSEASSSQTISLKNKSFSLGDIDLGNEINVVIASTAFEHAFYETSYDPDNPQPPACFAIGQEENKLVPHADSPNPQSADCKDCPHNEFGSALTGKGKRCRNSRRLAIYAYGDEGLSTEQVPVVRLPPTSLKAYATYAKTVAAKLKRPTYAVVTTLSFDPKFQHPVIVPVMKKAIESAPEMEAIMNGMDMAHAAVAEPYDVGSYDESNKTAPPKKSKMS